MLFPTHFIGGALAALIVTPRTDPVAIVAAMVIGSMSALLPDIGSPRSFIGARAPVVSTAVKMVAGHRGPFHSLLAAAGVCAMAYWFLPSMFTNFAQASHYIFWGYVSHLALDMLNPAGVPLLWPLSGRLSLPIAQTGGFIEKLLVFPAVIIAFAYFFNKKMGGVFF